MNGLSVQQVRDYRAAVTIRDRAEDVNVYLAGWQDETRDGAARRQALTDAVQSIDTILSAAHRLRESLLGQARLFDDEAIARADALLARIRKERES